MSGNGGRDYPKSKGAGAVGRWVRTAWARAAHGPRARTWLILGTAVVCVLLAGALSLSFLSTWGCTKEQQRAVGSMGLLAAIDELSCDTGWQAARAGSRSNGSRDSQQQYHEPYVFTCSDWADENLDGQWSDSEIVDRGETHFSEGGYVVFYSEDYEGTIRIKIKTSSGDVIDSSTSAIGTNQVLWFDCSCLSNGHYYFEFRLENGDVIKSSTLTVQNDVSFEIVTGEDWPDADHDGVWNRDEIKHIGETHYDTCQGFIALIAQNYAGTFTTTINTGNGSQLTQYDEELGTNSAYRVNIAKLQNGEYYIEFDIPEHGTLTSPVVTVEKDIDEICQ